MADNFFRVRNGLNLGNLVADPASGVNGDVFYNTSTNTIREFVDGAWRDAVQTDNTQTLSGKTLTFLKTNVTTDATSTGANSTLAAADITVGIARLTNVSLTSISGIPAGASGQFLTIENQTGASITINNDDAGATAANRIFTGTGASITVRENASIALVYDATALRWMIIGGTGGSSANAGEVAITTGTTSIVVTLATVMATANYAVLAQMANTVDANPQFQPITITNKTTTSFTATWNAPVDSSNYLLEYITSGDVVAFAGSGVSSVNGLTGAITLAAGTNITIVPTGNTLTINATAGTSSYTTIASGGSVTGTYTGDVYLSPGTSTLTGNTIINGNLYVDGNTMSSSGAFSLTVLGNVSGIGTLGLNRATGGAGSFVCKGNVAGDLVINTSATTSGTPGNMTMYGDVVARTLFASSVTTTGGTIAIHGNAVISGNDGGNIDCIIANGTTGGTINIGGNFTGGTWDGGNADVGGNISVTGIGATGVGGIIFVEGNFICPFIFAQGSQSGAGGSVNIYGNASASLIFVGGGHITTGTGNAGAGGNITIGGNVTSIIDFVNGGNGSGGNIPSLGADGGTTIVVGTAGNAGNGGSITIGGNVTATFNANGGARATATNAGTAGDGGLILIYGGAAGLFSTVDSNGGANGNGVAGSAGTLLLHGSAHSFRSVTLIDGATGTAPTVQSGVNFNFGTTTIGTLTTVNRTDFRLYGNFEANGTSSAIVKINAITGKVVFTNMTAPNTFGGNTATITTTSLYMHGNGTWRVITSAAA